MVSCLISAVLQECIMNNMVEKLVAFIFHMQIDGVYQEYSRLIVLRYIGRGESCREPDQEPPPC